MSVVRVLHLVQYHNINRQHVQDLLIVSVVRVLLVRIHNIKRLRVQDLPIVPVLRVLLVPDHNIN